MDFGLDVGGVFTRYGHVSPRQGVAVGGVDGGFVSLGERVRVAVGVYVQVGKRVGDGVWVGVGVSVGAGVFVRVIVGVEVGVSVGVDVNVFVGVGVSVKAIGRVSVIVGDAVDGFSTFENNGLIGAVTIPAKMVAKRNPKKISIARDPGKRSLLNCFSFATP